MRTTTKIKEQKDRRLDNYQASKNSHMLSPPARLVTSEAGLDFNFTLKLSLRILLLLSGPDNNQSIYKLITSILEQMKTILFFSSKRINYIKNPMSWNKTKIPQVLKKWIDLNYNELYQMRKEIISFIKQFLQIYQFTQGLNGLIRCFAKRYEVTESEAAEKVKVAINKALKGQWLELYDLALGDPEMMRVVTEWSDSIGHLTEALSLLDELADSLRQHIKRFIWRFFERSERERKLIKDVRRFLKSPKFGQLVIQPLVFNKSASSDTNERKRTSIDLSSRFVAPSILTPSAPPCA